MTPRTMPRNSSGPGPAQCHSELRQRLCRLLETEIDFIPNPAFAAEQCCDWEFIDATLATLRESATAPAELPAHLRRMCESELLSREQESALFCAMNFLKYRAAELQCQLDLQDLDAALVDQLEQLLQRAQLIRDCIVEANTRLVISIVKKFVSPQQSFDDMLSDGIFTLMQTVEKFDFDRGFRFSTYAYRSIARDAYRSVNAARKEEAKFTRDAEEWAFEQPDDQSCSPLKEKIWNGLRTRMADLLEKLDPREQLIVRSRYALGAECSVVTFQSLANQLGVSKERVRQLEQRAVGKLRKWAGELDLDELFC